MVIYYIIGTGPSIKNITNEEWDFLKNKNTFAFGSFPFCGIKTRFFMNYERPNVNISDAYSLKDKWNHTIYVDTLKKYGNLDTTLLLGRRNDIKLAFNKGFRYLIPIIKMSALFYPSRKPWFLDEDKPPHKFKECRAHSFRQPLFRFRGSLSAAINSCLILGATEIRLLGVDLNCQHDFYVDNPDKWIPNEQVRNAFKDIIFPQRLKKLEEKAKIDKTLDSEINHTTDVPYRNKERWGNRALRGMSDVLRWMDEELREEGICRIYNTSKISKLYKENILEYKSIIDK